MGLLRRLQRSGSHTEPAGSVGSAADSDGRLVALAQGDPGAFGPLYDRYFPAVYGYCLSELRDPEGVVRKRLDHRRHGEACEPVERPRWRGGMLLRSHARRSRP